MIRRIISLLMVAAMFVATSTFTAAPASAQAFGVVQPAPLSGNCNYSPVIGMDTSNGTIYSCGNNHVWLAAQRALGIYQGFTSTSITTGSFTSLTGPNIKIPAQQLNIVGKGIRIKGKGVYTTGAASLLGVRIALCTGSNACGGGVLAPAGCSVITTNQANILSNGQFWFECEFTTASVGASGTLAAKAVAHVQLGAATSAAMSTFMDTSTAASAAVDLTQDEYVVPQFQFQTSNAGNAATIQQMSVEALN